MARSRDALDDPGRAEAFSDGVFAIAITLIVLEIGVPHVESDQSLWSALGKQWPSYAAYVVSFLVIGIVWANHHTLFSYIARVDRTLLFLNLLILLTVALIPWPTSLVADYLDTGGSQAKVAVAVYSMVNVAMAATFSLFWWYVVRRAPHLLHDDVDRAAASASLHRFSLGLLVYPLTVLLAFVVPIATMAVHGVIAVYYAFNQLSIPRSGAAPAEETA
ncbi:MAG TPA: TMEM175 family protein [Actinomycetes bacterium]|nr:TMEM175 family protein [Actinomycetes bacterium]